ncbi:MAG: DUF72 domain-containing protein [Acidobacteria bacterium]|nr:MAG: DUF72 domain-containing protein [Acidobacteriota bacterium]
MGEVRIGTCGWSYPSGAGTWNGIFYPSAGSRPPGFNELAYYAQHFDTVEVNVTFYRSPARATAERWARQTPERFDFSVKLYQSFTHARPVQRASSAPQSSPPRVATSSPPSRRGDDDDEPAPSRGRIALPEFTAADVDAFRRGIDPIASAGKLGALLAQFPPGFRSTPETLGYLARLLAAFRDYPLAVELRHRSWSDDREGTQAPLREFGAALVEIDEPKFRFSIRQDRVPVAGGLYYMRLHGRNWAKWWKHDSPDDRYDYLYTGEELKPFADTVENVRPAVKRAYVYMNNHFSAKAVANAAALKHMLGDPLPGTYSPEFLARYPDLAGIVQPASSGDSPDEDEPPGSLFGDEG